MSSDDWHTFTSSFVISDSDKTVSEHDCSLFAIFSIKNNFAGETETVFPVTLANVMENRIKNNIFLSGFISLQR